MTKLNLFDYYENELSFVRKNLQTFARNHPSHAKGLGIHRDHIEDPDVLRLVESFSLLTARLHKRLDNDLDDLSGDLLEALCPDLVAAIPSATILGFTPDPESPEKTVIPAGTIVECHDDSTLIPKLTTRKPVELWPITLSHVALVRPPYSHSTHYQARSEARLELTLKPCSADVGLSELEGLDHLDVFIDMDAHHSGAMYEYVHTRCLDALVIDGQGQVEVLGQDAITKLRYEGDGDKRQSKSSLSFSLLRDYFVFPRRFLYLRISGLGQSLKRCQEFCHIHLYFDRYEDQLAKAIDGSSLKLFTSPAANVFAKTFEPIEMRAQELSYEVIADNSEKRFTEVQALDEVKILGSDGDEQPAAQYYDAGNLLSREEGTPHYWLRRQINPDAQQPASLAITFEPADGEGLEDQDRVALCQGTANNRDYFNRLSYYDYASLHYQFEEPVSTVTKIDCLGEFTKYASVEAEQKWLLLSQLRPMSLGGTSGLQYIYDLFTLFSQNTSATVDLKAIVGIEAKSTRKKAIVDSMPVLVFGTLVTLSVDPKKCLGINLYLLCEIIWQMLQENTPINSYTAFRVVAGNTDLYSWEGTI